MASAPRFTKLQCFSILGLKEGSSQEEIKKAYRELAMKYHPDHYKGSDNIFKDIQEAYECLENGNFKSERNQEEPKTQHKSNTNSDSRSESVKPSDMRFQWVSLGFMSILGLGALCNDWIVTGILIQFLNICYVVGWYSTANQLYKNRIKVVLGCLFAIGIIWAIYANSPENKSGQEVPADDLPPGYTIVPDGPIVPPASDSAPDLSCHVNVSNYHPKSMEKVLFIAFYNGHPVEHILRVQDNREESNFTPPLPYNKSEFWYRMRELGSHALTIKSENCSVRVQINVN